MSVAGPGVLRDLLRSFSQRLDRLEQGLTAVHALLLRKDVHQDWFGTKEVAQALHRSEYTVRQWCAQQRLKAVKTKNGREWRIQRGELDRYHKEGLLPL